MLIVEIALGIVLAVLILSYLPQILGLAIGVVALALLLGVLTGVVALAISSPELLYFGCIFISLAFFNVFANHTNRLLLKHNERLPSWGRSSLKRANDISWTLLLFSSLLALLASIAVLIAIGWALQSLKFMDSAPAWAWSIGGIALPGILTWLIYRLPWPTKAHGNTKNERQTTAS